MDNQRPTSAPNPSPPANTTPQPQQQPPSLAIASVTPQSNSQMTTKQSIRKKTRITVFLFGVFLVIFSISIASGQASHGWNATGIIMILFFGLIGLYMLYYSIFRKKTS